jgi:hypothetical protein
MVIALESNKASYAELKTYAQKLEDYLRTIPAASKSNVLGSKKNRLLYHLALKNFHNMALVCNKS